MSEFVPLQFEDVGKMRVELEQARAEIERLRAALLSCPCPGGGWNGMPTGVEATVAACIKNNVCGCDLGRALGGQHP